MVTLLNDNVDVNIRGMTFRYQFFISLLTKGHDRDHETLTALHYKTASTGSTTSHKRMINMQL